MVDDGRFPAVLQPKQRFVQAVTSIDKYPIEPLLQRKATTVQAIFGAPQPVPKPKRDISTLQGQCVGVARIL